MTHDDAFASLGALALDALDATDRVSVLSHVADCPVCRPELESLRAAAANIAFAAPLAADSATFSRARIRDRLSARATAEGQARRLANPPLVFPKANEEEREELPPEPPTPRPRSFHAQRAAGRHPAEWFAIAAGVLLVLSLGAVVMLWGERVNLQERLASEPVRDIRSRETLDSLRTLVATRDSTIAGLVGRDVSIMTLTSRTAKDPYARLFWDRSRNAWTMFARNMPALKAGRTYQLWIVTSRATVSAGTFDAVNGAGVIRATLAVTPETLRAIAVTEEPSGGVTQPTGDTIISATNSR